MQPIPRALFPALLQLLVLSTVTMLLDVYIATNSLDTAELLISCGWRLLQTVRRACQRRQPAIQDIQYTIPSFSHSFMMTIPTLDSSTVACDDSGVYRTLLESTRAIPWRIDWATMRFTYIGPQIEELLGWKQSSWLSVNDWAERIHEEDRKKTVDFCVAQSNRW